MTNPMSIFLFGWVVGLLFTPMIVWAVLAPVTMFEVGYALEKCESNGGLKEISRRNEKFFTCVNGAEFKYPRAVQ